MKRPEMCLSLLKAGAELSPSPCSFCSVASPSTSPAWKEGRRDGGGGGKGLGGLGGFSSSSSSSLCLSLESFCCKCMAPNGKSYLRMALEGGPPMLEVILELIERGMPFTDQVFLFLPKLSRSILFFRLTPSSL